jgi:hypothetical protein
MNTALMAGAPLGLKFADSIRKFKLAAIPLKTAIYGGLGKLGYDSTWQGWKSFEKLFDKDANFTADDMRYLTYALTTLLGAKRVVQERRMAKTTTDKKIKVELDNGSEITVSPQ